MNNQGNTSLRQWVLLVFTVFLLVPFSYNCIEKPLEFKSPEWVTQLSVPLYERTFYFGDLVEKDSKFDTTSGVIYYKPTENIQPVRKGLPADAFVMPSPKGNTINQEIGIVPVSLGQAPSFSISASDLGISSADLNPQMDPKTVELNPSQLGIPTGINLIADFPSLPISEAFGDTNAFQYIVFADGTMGLKITNNFPFAIQFTGNKLDLVNYNVPGDSVEVVASFTFTGPIAAKSFQSATSPLNGKKMDGILKLKGEMSTSGAAGQQLSDNDKLVGEVSVTNYHLQSIVPDPAQPVAINETFGDTTKYLNITFENGQMSLQITNTFPFTIGFAGNKLDMYNLSDTNTIFASFIFPGTISSGATVSSNTIDLANKKMDAMLKIKGTVNLSDYIGKTIGAGDKLLTEIQLSNTEIQSAFAKTDDFDGTNVINVPDSAVHLDDSIKVKSATFESGAMKVRIINKVPLRLTVAFQIDELIDNHTNVPYHFPDPSYNPATGTITIQPNDSLLTTIDMTKVSFVSRNRVGNDTLTTQDLHFKLAIKTLSASDDYVEVNKSDYVIADVQPEGTFILKNVQGKIPPQTIAIQDTFNVGIGDIGNRFTMEKFTSAIELATDIFLTGGFKTDVDLDIVPINNAGIAGNSVHIAKELTPSISSGIQIDSSDINKLMNAFMPGELPAKFALNGSVVVNPRRYYDDNSVGVGVGSVSSDDSVFVKMDYAIPVAVGIKNGVLRDTSSFSQSVDTAMVNLIQNGKIYFDIDNYFPLNIELQMALLKKRMDDSTRADTSIPPVLTIPQSTTDTLTYPPIKIAPDTSPDNSGERSFTFLNLSPEDAKKLSEAAFSAVALHIQTGASGSRAREFKKEDKLKLKVAASINFLVSEERLSQK
ncbi:MAG: hypothetical protein H3C35_08315 [Bacteroidetes bacterium]|nr:hypothetical protein [Bacteroidota bacterium]